MDFNWLSWILIDLVTRWPQLVTEESEIRVVRLYHRLIVRLPLYHLLRLGIDGWQSPVDICNLGPLTSCRELPCSGVTSENQWKSMKINENHWESINGVTLQLNLQGSWYALVTLKVDFNWFSSTLLHFHGFDSLTATSDELGPRNIYRPLPSAMAPVTPSGRGAASGRGEWLRGELGERQSGGGPKLALAQLPFVRSNGATRVSFAASALPE